MQKPHEVVFLNVHETRNLRDVKLVVFHVPHLEIYLMKNKIRTSKTQELENLPEKASRQKTSTLHTLPLYYPRDTWYNSTPSLPIPEGYLVQFLQKLEGCRHVIVKQYRD